MVLTDATAASASNPYGATFDPPGLHGVHKQHRDVNLEERVGQAFVHCDAAATQLAGGLRNPFLSIAGQRRMNH
eukprot:6465177-Amphidinium_carterae.1